MNPKINAVLTDYDGTLVPINISRDKSRLSEQLSDILKQLSKKAIFGIISMKDYWFLRERIPFAQIYGCIGGFEIVINSQPFIRKTILNKFKAITNFYKHVLELVEKPQCIEIEAKRLINKRIVGLSIDWRECKSVPSLVSQLEMLAQKMNIHIINYDEPFIDLMPDKPDKGEVIKFIKNFLKIKGSILYLGDSPFDNTAFKVSDISIGVISNNDPKKLESKYFIKFDDITNLFMKLIESDMIFDEQKLPIFTRDVI